MRRSLLYFAQVVVSVCALDAQLVPRATEAAVPISVPPSQNWDGDDGLWSSFTIQVGTPPQDVRVFISTASSNTLVVRTDGCRSSDTACANNRGMLFNPNMSTSWEQKGNYQITIEQEVGTDIQGAFGNDTVALGIQGSGGPSLQDQIVSAYIDQDLYVGMFGVNPASTNFTETDQNRPSYISTLRSQGMIPSLSFGYTAGNQYRLKSVFGSLILGGYDSSLFIPNTVSIPMAPDVGKELLVGIQSINLLNDNGTSSVLMQDGIMARVDTTVATFWLPEAACQRFEQAFGLKADSKTGLYLINDTQHTKLLQQNASVTFTLGATVSGGNTVNITLPYDSFDSLVKPPAFGVGQNSKYFPLQKAANDSQYILGRAFFQEAYLTVDWERRNFSISQCSFDPDSRQQTLVAINSTQGSSSSSSSSNGSSSKGKTVGIAVGVVVAVVVVIGGILAFFLIRRHRRRKAQAALNDKDEQSTKIRQGYEKPEMGTGVDNQRYEMEGDAGYAKKQNEQPVSEWVNEKARFPPGESSDVAEADAGSSSRAELGGPRVYGRAVHEMQDPKSQPRFELPADQPGELQGSTPGSSMPNSPVSTSTRQSRGFRSPFSKASSPLISSASDTDGGTEQRRPSRLSLRAFRRSNRESSSSGPSAPSQPSDDNHGHARGASSSGEDAVPTSAPSSREAFSPVSRRGTFERSGTPSSVTSPISPQTPGPVRGGLFERIRSRPRDA